ncbi:MAG TPA: 50S ribosomal protein L24 [Alphaproteobacteria bacterium]|nr:50S ribosomal protein L24 [Alphaproteobacteria bacterium]HAM48464.1 50S ribosomal protein L24 [Alphaproteobacteria bacterium]HBA42470.1 50S ribosomal protein L24 [Alphaproteobacteria bacterium]HBC54595.1 50S ribosomal protein L24 [Alphaproteobacteria bacterium]HBF97690.1 50S ribosomal protein L24 [Alphaproteobacteria bacterium]
MAAKSKIKKGDKVIVLTGRDKGKQGEVLKMLPAERRAVVQGVNQVKRHTRPSANSGGGIVVKEASIHISNLAVVDPKTGEATRIGYRTLEDGRKVRFAKASGEVIDV